MTAYAFERKLRINAVQDLIDDAKRMCLKRDGSVFVCDIKKTITSFPKPMPFDQR